MHLRKGMAFRMMNTHQCLPLKVTVVRCVNGLTPAQKDGVLIIAMILAKYAASYVGHAMLPWVVSMTTRPFSRK
jgi:hypothetical protein